MERRNETFVVYNIEGYSFPRTAILNVAPHNARLRDFKNIFHNDSQYEYKFQNINNGQTVIEHDDDALPIVDGQVIAWLVPKNSVPTFGPDVCTDPKLQKSIDFASNVMRTTVFLSMYNCHYKSPKTIQNLNKLQIKFSESSKSPESIEHVFAWVVRKAEPLVIHINDKFRKRFDRIVESKERLNRAISIEQLDNNEEGEQFQRDELEKLKKEEETIQFFIGKAIMHEMAHLLLRWSGYLWTPSYMIVSLGDSAEAGYYLEMQLFRSVIRMVVPKGSSANWSETTPILGLAVKFPLKLDGKILKTVWISHDYIRKALNNQLNLDDILKIEIDSHITEKSTDWETFTSSCGKVDEDIKLECELDENEYQILDVRCLQIDNKQDSNGQI